MYLRTTNSRWSKTAAFLAPHNPGRVPFYEANEPRSRFQDLPLYMDEPASFAERFSLAMQKTKKSVAKRFKITGSGKLVRRSPGKRHLLSCKSPKQKRRLSKDKLVAEGQAAQLLKCLPFGLK